MYQVSIQSQVVTRGETSFCPALMGHTRLTKCSSSNHASRTSAAKAKDAEGDAPISKLPSVANKFPLGISQNVPNQGLVWLS